MIPPVVFVIGASNVVAFPVNGPPMIISPYSPSIPPALSIRSATLVPTGTSLNTCGSFPPFNLPMTVRFLLKHGFLSSIASVTLASVSTLITIDFATEGRSVGFNSIPRHSLTTALSSPIG